jgi:high-affinity iron transporter
MTLGTLPAVAVVLASIWPAAAAPPSDSPTTRAQTILHMLDYVAGDYPAVVKDGTITDESEYKEQIDFVSQAITMLGDLPERAEQAALIEQARRLLALIQTKGSAPDVERLAGEIRQAVIKAYQVPVAPSRPPDLAAARALYAARCAACHGANGRGDGPAAKGMEPAPTNFHDRGRMERRSVYSLYSTITLGVQGTPMAAFADLSDDQRWGLAFHVAGLGDDEGERRRGAAVWERGRNRGPLSDLSSLTMATATEMKARHGQDAVAVLAYLRTRPDLAATSGGSALAHSTRLLSASLQAYHQGRAREALDLAVISYFPVQK